MPDATAPADGLDEFRRVSGDPLDGWLLWAITAVGHGLTSLAGGEGWEGLREAGEPLPADLQAEWRAVVRDGEGVWDGVLAVPRADAGAAFYRLVQHLNERWLISRRLLVVCGAADPPLPFKFTVYRIDQDQRLASPVGEVRSFLVAPLFPRNHRGVLKTRRANDSIPYTGWVRMDVDHWNLCSLSQFSYPDEQYRQQCVGNGQRPEQVEQQRRAAEAHARRFPTPFSWQRAMLYRTQTELVREAVDRLRVLRVDPEAELTGEFRWLLPDVLLSPGCRLRHDLFTPPVDRAAADADLEQQRRSQTVTHLSAQLTAAAVAGSPQTLVIEWMNAIEFTVSQLPPDPDAPAAPVLHPHEAAARLAVALLAEQLGLSSRWSFRDLRRGDCVQLGILCESVYRRPAEELRLALKAVYRRELDCGPIDDPPFASIADDGTLGPLRPLPNPTADP